MSYPAKEFDFEEWFPPKFSGYGPFIIEGVEYSPNGALIIGIAGKAGNAGSAVLEFDAPIAVRIVGEGSLMKYWENGFVVRGHSIFSARNSDFLRWLDSSSAGVHASDKLTHYAIFSDDICVEVISYASPDFTRA